MQVSRVAFLFITFPLFLIAVTWPRQVDQNARPTETDMQARSFIQDPHGAIIRGDVSKKQIALVLTGG